MQLRDGLKFSDGTPITGEVVKQNIERALSLPESSIAPSMAKIANVQAEGNTIRIHQKEPDATLPALLSDRPGMIVNPATRSEEHTSELQSLMRISYAVFCLKEKQYLKHITTT